LAGLLIVAAELLPQLVAEEVTEQITSARRLATLPARNLQAARNS
jgi:hypothetical protein